jgi:hypothetical protein
MELNNLQTLINSNLIDIYKTFPKSDYNIIINNIKNTYYTKSKHTYNHFFPLIKYIIKNNEIDYEVLLNDKIYDKNTYPKLNNIDSRIINTFELIKKSIKYSIKKNRVVPNTILFIWISDRYPWDKDVDKQMPIYLYAKPKDTSFLIFPDNTFNCLTLDKKYNGKCYDYNIIKKKILKHCANDFNDKPNIMYFKGTPTTKKTTKLRETLESYSKKTNWLQIHLDAWTKYEKIYEMNNYKYLLNLPGHYPWSNRFKYLFLMKSLVININTNMQEYNNLQNDKIEYWISFIDYIVKPNEDYINIDAKYYWSSDQNLQNKYSDMSKSNDNETLRIFNELKNIMKKYNNNYDKIIKSGYDKVKELSNRHIYNYIYECIVQNSKLIPI